MADIQMHDVSHRASQSTTFAPSRRSARLQSKADERQLQRIALQAMFQPVTKRSDHRNANKKISKRRSPSKKAVSVEQQHATDGNHAVYNSPKLGKRAAMEALGAPHKASRLADIAMDVDQQEHSHEGASDAGDESIQQVEVPEAFLLQQPEGPVKRHKQRKRVKNNRNSKKQGRGAQPAASAGNATKKRSQTKMQWLGSADHVQSKLQGSKVFHIPCQVQQELRRSKRLKVSHTSFNDLPYDTLEVIARFLEDSDALAFMATSKPVAKMVLSSRDTTGKPRVSVHIDKRTNWLPLQEIISLGTSIRLVFAQYCDAAIIASSMGRHGVGDTRLLGIREIVLKEERTTCWLPGLAIACSNAHTYDFQFSLTDGVLQHLVTTAQYSSNITSLRVGGVEDLECDWRNQASSWKHLHIHSEHIPYSSMQWMPLQSLEQPVEWTSPTEMMCLIMPDSKDPDGHDTVMQAHENMHNEFFKIPSGAVLHYFIPRAVHHSWPEGEGALHQFNALTIAPHWPVIDLNILESEIRTTITVVAVQNTAQSTRTSGGPHSALDCLRFCIPSYGHKWHCHSLDVVSIPELKG